MSGYTKLFSSILASTVWREDKNTRLVWITLLAMADKNGVAEGSIPGLADFARVSVAEVEESLLKLSSPDPYSRSKEHQGRRICEIDGGWQILNHAKYRAKMSADERREYLRLKQAEYRRGKQSSTPVNNVSDTYTVLTHTEAKADTDPKAEKNKNDVAPSRPLISGEASPKGWGKQHGEHVAGFCDWVCLPEFIFAEFCRKSGQQTQLLAEAYVRGWTLNIRGSFEGKPVGDNLKFWRARWSESHPEKVGAAVRDDSRLIEKLKAVEGKR